MNNKKFITENIVLNAFGYTQNNRGYYDYSNSYFDEDIELKVGNSYHAMGFNIIIKEITNEFVMLEVLKSDYDVSKKDYVYKFYQNITLKDFNHTYIEKYSYSSGRDDYFVIDSAEFSIMLKESKIIKITHTVNSLNTSLQQINSLLDINRSYFQLLDELEVLIFRGTDEKYLTYMTKANDYNKLQEVTAIKNNLELIQTIIDLIKEYNNYNIDLILNCYHYSRINHQEYLVLNQYLEAITNDYIFRDFPYLNELEKLYNELKRKKFIDQMESFKLNYQIFKLYKYSKFYFKGEHIVNDLLNRLSKNLDIKSDEAALVYCEIAEYYKLIYKRKKALECYKLAKEYSIKAGNKKQGAYYIAEYLRLLNVFPEHLKGEVDLKSLINEFNEYMDIIVSAASYKPLKVDEIEFSESFIRYFPAVMNEVENKIKELGDLHHPYQRFELIKEAYAKRNINWKTPKEMNPHVKFD